ncbi:MAG: hypothetical protein F7C81_00390 [Desulfurococcales archaeon]|nr:hypothetical protein [Desulfurococcales archaeon]
MSRDLLVFIVTIYIILLILVLTATLIANQAVTSKIDWLKARDFLESQYVPEARLLRAATVSYPDNITIWIASDNLLASRSLKVFGSPLADDVLEKLNDYDGGWNGKHDILLLRGIGQPRNTTSHYLGNISGYMIMWDKADGEILDDWEGYADWIVYAALNSTLQGDVDRALELYKALMQLWDGYGFYDHPAKQKGVYDVYKLALAVYLHRVLDSCSYGNLDGELYDKWIDIIAGAQRSDGGFITNYMIVDGKIIFTGDANTETTSMVVLALLSDYPDTLGRLCKLNRLLVEQWILDSMMLT